MVLEGFTNLILCYVFFIHKKTFILKKSIGTFKTTCDFELPNDVRGKALPVSAAAFKPVHATPSMQAAKAVHGANATPVTAAATHGVQAQHAAKPVPIVPVHSVHGGKAQHAVKLVPIAPARAVGPAQAQHVAKIGPIVPAKAVIPPQAGMAEQAANAVKHGPHVAHVAI